MKIAIVGAGKLGLKVTNALTGGDHSITIIDQNEAIINRISQQYDVMTVVGCRPAFCRAADHQPPRR